MFVTIFKDFLIFSESLGQQTTTAKPQGLQTVTGLQTATVIGILPGLGAYNNDTSDSESSSSDSEVDIRLAPAKIYVKVEQE